MYRLRVLRSAEAELRRLPRPIFDRMNERILALREQPRPDGARKLHGGVEGWRIRVGDYRVVYRIDDTERSVTIVKIGHRREIYRP